MIKSNESQDYGDVIVRDTQQGRLTICKS